LHVCSVVLRLLEAAVLLLLMLLLMLLLLRWLPVQLLLWRLLVCRLLSLW